jgi:hypothetical protein
MKNNCLLLGAALALSTAGCLPPVSLQPLYTTDDAVEQPEVFGIWRAADDDSTRMIIRRSNPAEYPSPAFDVVFVEKGHSAHLYTGHLVRLDDSLFWDVEPVQSEEWKDHPAVVAAHLILRANVADDTLRLTPLREERFQELADIECSDLSATEADDRIVLTASTDRLREFLAAHANDPDVFMEEPLVYSRVPAPDSPSTVISDQ